MFVTVTYEGPGTESNRSSSFASGTEASSAWPGVSAPGEQGKPASASVAWPLPTWAELFQLETRRATTFYWTALFLIAAALFIPKLLPCVDYPQHLALSDIARRLEQPGAPEHGVYQLNYFTYNALFHLVVAKVSKVIPVEMAGRIVVAFSLLLAGGSVLALVRVLRRPPSYAAFFVPIVFSFSVGWGFLNYSLAFAIAVFTTFWICRCIIRPSIWQVVLIGALAGLCAFAHVLAMLFLCALAVAVGPELAVRLEHAIAKDRSLGWKLLRAFGRSFLAIAPLLIGCAFCIAVYQQQYDWDPQMYRDPTVEGTNAPIYEKILLFGAFATDLYSDFTDQLLVDLSLLIIGWAVFRVYGKQEKNAGATASPSEYGPAFLMPFGILTLAYMATPMVFIGTHLIFPRLAQGVVLGAVLLAPHLRGPFGERILGYGRLLGLVAAVNLVLHISVFAYETNDASLVLDDLPQGRRATAVIWDPKTYSFRNGTLVHLAAYYAARKHGEWAFGFARYLSVPVRFKNGGHQPAWPVRGWEFDASDYNPRCKYARYYDLAIVRAPSDILGEGKDEAVVRQLVFKEDAEKVKLLSHHGVYWAFDTNGLPEDGTF